MPGVPEPDDDGRPPPSPVVSHHPEPTSHEQRHEPARPRPVAVVPAAPPTASSPIAWSRSPATSGRPAVRASRPPAPPARPPDPPHPQPRRALIGAGQVLATGPAPPRVRPAAALAPRELRPASRPATRALSRIRAMFARTDAPVRDRGDPGQQPRRHRAAADARDLRLAERLTDRLAGDVQRRARPPRAPGCRSRAPTSAPSPRAPGRPRPPPATSGTCDGAGMPDRRL